MGSEQSVIPEPDVKRERHNYTQVKLFTPPRDRSDAPSPLLPIMLETVKGTIPLTSREADRLGQELMQAAKTHWRSHEDSRS